MHPRKAASISVCGILFLAAPVCDTLAQVASHTNRVTILSYEGRVEISRAGSPEWDVVLTNALTLLPGDRFRTSDRARAVLMLSDRSQLPVGPSSVLEIPRGPERKTILNILRG